MFDEKTILYQANAVSSVRSHFMINVFCYFFYPEIIWRLLCLHLWMISYRNYLAVEPFVVVAHDVSISLLPSPEVEAAQWVAHTRCCSTSAAVPRLSAACCCCPHYRDFRPTRRIAVVPVHCHAEWRTRVDRYLQQRPAVREGIAWKQFLIPVSLHLR